MKKSLKVNKQLKFRGELLTLLMKKGGTKQFKLLYKFRNFQFRNIKGVNCSSEWITRKDGTKMRLCIYKPFVKKYGPAILWLHGGGYAMGIPEASRAMCKRLIDAGGAVVVSPDYTLSVKKPYPAALDDGYLTLLWLKENANRFYARGNQLMIGGESAGGGLALALTLLARDKKEVSIAYAMPVYPMLDDKTAEWKYDKNFYPGWNAYNNFQAWKLYLDGLYGSDEIPYYAAPSRAQDLSNMPPVSTFVGSLDPFLNEVQGFFERLKIANVTAICRVYEGCYHGFDIVAPRAEISKKAVDEFLQSFIYAVENYFAKQP